MILLLKTEGCASNLLQHIYTNFQIFFFLFGRLSLLFILFFFIAHHAKSSLRYSIFVYDSTYIPSYVQCPVPTSEPSHLMSPLTYAPKSWNNLRLRTRARRAEFQASNVMNRNLKEKVNTFTVISQTAVSDIDVHPWFRLKRNNSPHS